MLSKVKRSIYNRTKKSIRFIRYLYKNMDTMFTGCENLHHKLVFHSTTPKYHSESQLGQHGGMRIRQTFDKLMSMFLYNAGFHNN